MRYSSKHFRYDAHPNTACAEASELAPAGQPMFGQLWQDSADLGLIIVDAKTGKEFEFYVDEEHRHDGEIQMWSLKAVPKRSNSARLNDMEVFVFND